MKPNEVYALTLHTKRTLSRVANWQNVGEVCAVLLSAALVIAWLMIPWFVYWGYDGEPHKQWANAPFGLRLWWPVGWVSAAALLGLFLGWHDIVLWFRDSDEWPWDHALQRTKKAIKS